MNIVKLALMIVLFIGAIMASVISLLWIMFSTKTEKADLIKLISKRVIFFIHIFTQQYPIKEVKKAEGVEEAKKLEESKRNHPSFPGE